MMRRMITGGGRWTPPLPMAHDKCLFNSIIDDTTIDDIAMDDTGMDEVLISSRSAFMK